MTCLALPCWVPRLLCRGLAWLTALACVTAAMAEMPRVFRCGNVYTNQPAPNQNCKPLSGGNVTVIEGTQVQTLAAEATVPQVATNASSSTSTSASASSLKVDPQAQRQRDAQASVLLQTELQKAQLRHVELLRLWNNGEPERLADEQRQPQKYQERVAQLRAALQRSEADVAGLQRELARLPVSSVGTTTP